MDEMGTSSSLPLTGGENAAVGCEMCANYELQLQKVQAEQDTLREQLAAAKELYEKYGKELTEERNYRKELEGKFASLNEETEQKIQECLTNSKSFEERLTLLGKKQEADLAICFQDLELAKNRQKEVQSKLIALNERYQKLLRINSQSAEEMREQQIELPQTVEELQFLALQLREDLINERAAREHETRELRDELTVAREQLLEMEIRDKEQEDLLIQAQQHQRRAPAGSGVIGTSSSSGRRERTSHSTSKYECSTLDASVSGSLGDCCPNHRQLIAELESQLTIALDKCAQLEDLLTDSKQRCSQMQNELDTSEAVQKDFVRLSQQLQTELEKIRQSEVEVRWQEPEDVSNCNGCNKKFTIQSAASDKKMGGNSKNNNSNAESIISGKKWSNCKHCGKIFCPSCLGHKVSSGPSKRPVTVCSLCYNLLSNHSLVRELKPEDI